MADAAPVSDYRWWRAKLAGKNPPTFPDKPQCGRFKLKRGEGYLPAALWVTNDGIPLLRIGVEDQSVDTEGWEEIAVYWPQLAKAPISDEEYKEGIAGKWINGNLGKVGDNQPPAENTPESIAEQVDNTIITAAHVLEIKGEENAKLAAGYRNRLLELAGNATKLHDAEKAPFLIKGKEIDARWFPTRDKAQDEADRLRKLLSDYETDKDRKRKAWEEEERKKAIAKGRVVEEPDDLGVPEKQQRDASYGKKRSVTEKTVIKSVENWDLIYQRYSLVPEVVEILTRLIMRDIGRGETIPGVVTETVKDVR